MYNTGNADNTGVILNPSPSSTSGKEHEEGEEEVVVGVEAKVRGGFGHIGITVPNVYEACQRFHHLGVQFHKSPNSGGMKGLAFIKDPDGYLVEVLPQGMMEVQEIDCLGVAASGGEGYKDNSK